MPDFFYLPAAMAIIVVTAWDAFITIFSNRGAGPVTCLWMRGVWRMLLYVHGRIPIHKCLALAGPLMLVSGILLWYLGLAAGAYMAFAASTGSVIHSDSGAAASPGEVLEFTSSTISSVGYGDLVPDGPAWTVAAGALAVAATMLLTASLSYMISVLSSALGRKRLAEGVFGLGTTIAEQVEAVEFEEDRRSLKDYYASITTDINDYALKHLAYPVLQYFHSPRSDHSPALAILLVADVFFLLDNLPDGRRTPRGLASLMRRAIDGYIEQGHTGAVSPDAGQQSRSALKDMARQLGVMDNAVFQGRLEEYLPRRAVLAAICREDGWAPHVAAGPAGEKRAPSPRTGVIG